MSVVPRIILIDFSVSLREDGWRDTIQISKSLFKAFARKLQEGSSRDSSLESGRTGLQNLWAERKNAAMKTYNYNFHINEATTIMI